MYILEIVNNNYVGLREKWTYKYIDLENIGIYYINKYEIYSKPRIYSSYGCVFINLFTTRF